MKRVNPKHYTRRYYLNECSGYKEFNETGGEKLEPRLDTIVREFPSVRNARVLDIGCGRGELALWLVKHGANYVDGIDYSENAIKLANKIKNKQNRKIANNINFIKLDATDIDQLNKKYDLVIMTEVYEHLYKEELDIVFSKIKKLLKENGVLYLHTSPNKLFVDYFYRY